MSSTVTPASPSNEPLGNVVDSDASLPEQGPRVDDVIKWGLTAKTGNLP
jgi:hypothetical protein